MMLPMFHCNDCGRPLLVHFRGAAVTTSCPGWRCSLRRAWRRLVAP